MSKQPTETASKQPTETVTTPIGLSRLTELACELGLNLKTLKWSRRRVFLPTGRYGQSTGECGYARLFSETLGAWVDIWYVSRGNGEWARVIRVRGVAHEP